MSATTEPAARVATITIVRHGDTFAPGEPPRRIGARTDVPLVASGEAQARALGAAFAAEGSRFDRSLVSPLSRTRQTAALILAAMPASPAIEPCDWLAEIDHGPDEDQPEAAVRARLGEAALARWDGALDPPAGWIVDAPRRLAGWRALLDVAAGHVLCVTSGGAARFAPFADTGLTEQARALPSLKLRTGAWGRIVVEGGRARLVAWDRRP